MFVFDNKTNGGENVASYSHTCGANAKLLVVVFFLRDGTESVTGITYGGQALTRAIRRAAGTGSTGIEIWYKVNPLTGANTVSISGSIADDGDSHTISFTGDVAAVPVDNTANGSNTTANPSVNITPNVDNCVVIGGVSSESGSAPATGTGETAIYNTDNGTWATGSSYDIQTTKELQAFNWTISADDWGVAVASFAPLSAVTYSKANSVKASIVRTESNANSVKANIVRTESKANSTKANIVATTSQANSVKAFIFGEGNFGNSVKANIITPNLTKDNSVIGDIEGQIYTRVNTGSLPADDTDLAIRYSNTEVGNVATSDDVRVDIDGAGYIIHQFKDHQTSVRDITVVWEGQVGTAPTTSTVYLQVYNHTSGQWENIDSDSTSNAGEDFILTGSLGGTLSDYFDSGNFTSFRVYQQN